MFNKKPRRNFRQRKNESSDEDDNEKLAAGEGGKDADSKADLPSKAGISSSSREARECDSSDAEEASVSALQPKDRKLHTDSKTLSFSDDKDCEYHTIATLLINVCVLRQNTAGESGKNASQLFIS